MLRPLFIIVALLFAAIPHHELNHFAPEVDVHASSESSEPLGWVMSVGGFYEDSIQSIVPLENNSALAGGTFTSSILIGDNGHDSNQLGFDDMDGFLA
ncbi:MAG: hypothetical protein CL959_02255, partial [Euryarchaeota archaeon]|nr:hypothetical protein [Euryarchaeota archaeon]